MSDPDAPAAGPPRRDLLAWLPVVLAAIAFFLLALITRGPNTLALDLRIAGWVQGFDGATGESLAVIGNVLGYSPVAVTALVVLASVLVLLRRPIELRFLLLVLVGRIVATRLKGVFESPRPDAGDVVVTGTFDGMGFPSGHVTTATVALGAVAFLLATWFPSRAAWTGLAVVVAVGVALTAWARIWYGAHWFTDTVGGALAGIAIVLAAANLSGLREDAPRPPLSRKS